MNIAANQIQEKKLAGVCKNGPVVYILTKGGLHSMFSRDGKGDIVSLAAAPHRAICTFFAEKKDPSIKWHSDFLSKTDGTEIDLIKNEEDQFQKYRKMIWFQTEDFYKSEASDIYFVYDTSSNDIWISDLNEIKEDLQKNEINRNCIVRPIDLSAPPRMLDLCDEFKVE
jgi:hypothetical protein